MAQARRCSVCYPLDPERDIERIDLHCFCPEEGSDSGDQDVSSLTTPSKTSSYVRATGCFDGAGDGSIISPDDRAVNVATVVDAEYDTDEEDYPADDSHPILMPWYSTCHYPDELQAAVMLTQTNLDLAQLSSPVSKSKRVRKWLEGIEPLRPFWGTAQEMKPQEQVWLPPSSSSQPRSSDPTTKVKLTHQIPNLPRKIAACHFIGTGFNHAILDPRSTTRAASQEPGKPVQVPSERGIDLLHKADIFASMRASVK